MKYLLWGLAAFGLLATFLPLIRTGYWWIRMFDFPRVQLLVFLIVIILALLFWMDESDLWSRGLAVLLAAAFILQAFRIFPYTPVASKQLHEALKDDPDLQLSVMAANVLQDNRTTKGFLDLVAEYDPDVLLVVENDEWWVEQLRSLEETYDYVVSHPLSNYYGMILYSKLPLKDAKVRYVVEDSIPSIKTQLQLRNGTWIDFYGVHPRPPQYKEDTFNRDAELVLVGRETENSTRPVVLAGDLNDVAWSHTTTLFLKLSGLLDPRRGRGFYNTFHANIPLVRWPLDHVFVSPDFRLVNIERLPGYGSDHFPMYLKLSYEPEHEREDEKLEATPEDHEEAQEKVEDAKEEQRKEAEKEQEERREN